MLLNGGQCPPKVSCNPDAVALKGCALGDVINRVTLATDESLIKTAL